MTTDFIADTIVVGAGAAGLMAAIFAAGRGRRVLLLESQQQAGRKILISGGGRCNVLPSRLSPSQYTTASSPNTLKKILLSWPLRDQQRFFERDLGIELALESDTGKLFPASNRARDIRDTLVERATFSGVRIHYDCAVDRVTRLDGAWEIGSGHGRFATRSLILATGGLSVPQTGSNGRGLRLVEALGHTVNSTYPALTPLTTQSPTHTGLAGISLSVALSVDRSVSSEGGFLFTHRGWSGPAVLDISHAATRSETPGVPPILARWTTESEAAIEKALTAGGSGKVRNALPGALPARLADALCGEAGVDPEVSLSQLRRDQRRSLIDALLRYPLPWAGDEGYKKAEVTGGGVELGEVDPRTLESRLHRGLFLCGEILDAFGPIGGYNFAWAWATGRAAGIGSTLDDPDSPS